MATGYLIAFYIMQVGIESVNGRLRLRLPRGLSDTRYINTRLDDNPANRHRCQMIAWEIEQDIFSGVISATLPHHRRRFVLERVDEVRECLTLLELWDMYTEYKKPSLAVTTYEHEYRGRFRVWMERLPQDLTKPHLIYQQLNQLATPDTLRRMLVHLNGLGKWAVSVGILKDNPFIRTEIQARGTKYNSIDPFSRGEMLAILEAFRNNRPHYFPFVSFLFLTGCRLGEAIGLQVGDISGKEIVIRNSYSSKAGILKTTKTGTVRRFPVNGQLGELLSTLPPSDGYRFTQPNGRPIDATRFTQQVWRGDRKYRGILPALIEQGSVRAYRPPYNTRHTFITLMLENGLTVSQVARLVGNSPEVILRHYAGDRVEVVPEV